MSAAVEEAGVTSGQGKTARPPAGQDASKRMHDYLLNQKRRKEDYFLRKYGKVIHPPKEAVEPKERPLTLPPLGHQPGGPSAPIFQAKGPIATFPNNASVVIDKAKHSALDRHHKLADIHYHPVAPPAYQTPHLPPLPRSRERSREGSGPGTPVKELSFASAQQQQDHLGGSPSAALPLLQQQQQRHAQLQQQLQQQQQRLQQQGVVDGSLLGRGPGEGLFGAMRQDGHAIIGGAHGLHAASPRSQRSQDLLMQPSQGKLQGLSQQSSRGLSNGEGSAAELGRPKKTGMRDLEVELSVIKAIKSREEVVDRLRTATFKVDHALGGGSPLVLNLNDPLLKMFFRLVTQLRHRTLDTIEAIGAWHRRTDSSEPFMFANVGNYLAYIGSDLAFLDETPFVKHRLYSVKAVDDPFLTEITPDGVPIDAASTVDLRRNAKFTADALRIRMARKILYLHGGHGRPPTGSTHADQATPSSLISGQEDSFVDGQHPGDDGSVDARNLPHSRAGSLAPLKEESSAWEGEASAGASAPESPQQIQPMEQRQQQLEGGGHEQGGVGGPQSGAAPKEVGFEFEGQVLRKEGERQQQAGMSDIDAQDKKAEQQQQQAAERGQFAGQPDGQYVADEEGDAGKYGELGAQHIHSSSGLTSDFFEREEQERLLQEQAAAAAAAETARQQEQLQEEWRQRDLADQRARQQLQEEEEREAARLREEEENARLEVAQQQQQHHLEQSLKAQRQQLAERQAQQAQKEHQQALLVEELSAAQYAEPRHPGWDLENSDEGIVLDSLLDALVSSLEEPYCSQVPPEGFTYQGWVIDRQLSAEIKELGPASATPAERSRMREQLARQHEQGFPALTYPLDAPSQQAPPPSPPPLQPPRSPPERQPSLLDSPIIPRLHSELHADGGNVSAEGEGIYAKEDGLPAEGDSIHAKGNNFITEGEGIDAEAECAPPELQPSFGAHPYSEPPTPHLAPQAPSNPALEATDMIAQGQYAAPSRPRHLTPQTPSDPALEKEPGMLSEVDQGAHTSGMTQDEAAIYQHVPTDHASSMTQDEATHQHVPIDNASSMTQDEEATHQHVPTDHESSMTQDEEATHQHVPIDQADLHLSGEWQPAVADNEQYDIDQVVSELVQDIDEGAGGEGEGGVEENGAQDEQQHQQEEDGRGSATNEGREGARGCDDRNGQGVGEEFDGSRNGELDEGDKEEGDEGRNEE
uniref:Uncharacterized protein n=1 Tax=Dunaliella tertiolecta TaxID=3047 RepID=A0A7S3QPF6_DUNTE